MTETYRVESGLLRTDGFELRLKFDLQISKFGELLIEFGEIAYSDHPDFWKILKVLSRLQNGPNRRVPFFSLSGKTIDGKMISTEHATVRSLRPTLNVDGKHESRIHFTGSASDLTIQHRPNPPKNQSGTYQVDYYSRAQRGFAVASVETRHRTLSATGPHELQDHADQSGVLSIETKSPPLEKEWIDRCDRLARRSLLLLSLGQGRTLHWHRKSVLFNEKLLLEKIRPTRLQEATLAATFSHLNLSPILELTVKSFTQEKMSRTGLDVALSWMLSYAPSIEGKYLNLLIALEHLISKFRPHSRTVEPKGAFRSKILSPLRERLNEMPKGNFSNPDAREIYQSRLANMNSAGFYSCVEQMIEAYCVPIEDLRDSLKFALVDCRNDLVHRGAFQGMYDELDRIYFHFDIVEEFTKRLVLAILEYKGTYNSPLYNLDLYVFEDGEVRPANPPRESAPPNSDSD